MTRLTLACSALLAVAPLTGALAQANFTPALNGNVTTQSATVAAGSSSGKRPFFYWLTGDSSDSGSAAPAPAASPVAAPAVPVIPAEAKTGSGIGIK